MLAFIYVPLTLATSVFGMDLQELNGSGRSLWIFIATVLAALAITGMTWMFLTELNRFRTWRRGLARPQETGDVRYAVSVRLYMFGGLILQGNGSWMVRTGIAWRLLVDSLSTFEPADEESSSFKDLTFSDLTAAEIAEHVIRSRKAVSNDGKSYTWTWASPDRDATEE